MFDPELPEVLEEDPVDLELEPIEPLLLAWGDLEVLDFAEEEELDLLVSPFLF